MLNNGNDLIKRFMLLDGNHRYKLMYEWDASKPKVMFIMLNPSYTRKDGQYSPTSKKVIDFAKANGFGGVWIGNLFSYISPVPSTLYSIKEPIGKQNDECLKQMAADSALIIFAWGNLPLAYARGKQISEMFPLGRPVSSNYDGSPAHPLSINFKPVKIKV